MESLYYFVYIRSLWPLIRIFLENLKKNSIARFYWHFLIFSLWFFYTRFFLLYLRHWLIILILILAIFTFNTFASWCTLYATIIAFTILFQTTRFFTVTSFFAQRTWMQSNDSFLLNEHFRFDNFFLMLESVLTRKTCTLICTWKIWCKALTIHFQALCFFANTFSFKKLLFGRIRRFLFLMKLLLISRKVWLPILFIRKTIFIGILILGMMLIHEMPLIIMLVIKVLLMGIKVIVVMTEI